MVGAAQQILVLGQELREAGEAVPVQGLHLADDARVAGLDARGALLVVALVTLPVGVHIERVLGEEVARALGAPDGGEVGAALGGVRAPLARAAEALAHAEVLEPLHGAVQGLGVGGADDLARRDPPRAVHEDGLVRAEGVAGVGAAVVGHDAAQPVHRAQVHAVLLDLEAVGVQLPARLQDLEVAVPFDVQIVEDEKDDLFFIDFIVDWGLDPLLKMGIELGVVFPDLLGSVPEAEGAEDSDAGVHHVDLVEVLDLDPGAGRAGGAALGVVAAAGVGALLRADGPVAADALDEDGGGGDLLVAAEAHRLGQLLRPHHHRALLEYQHSLLDIFRGSEKSPQLLATLHLIVDNLIYRIRIREL